MIPEQELLLLSQFRQNARNNLTSISRSIRMPVSTIFDKLKRYEGSVIIRHCALIDFEKLGFGTKANIILKVKREQREEIADYLSKHFNVNSLYRINNNHDFLLESVFKDLTELEEFLEELEDKFTIKKKEVYHIIKEVCREGFMANPISAEMLAKQQKH